ncbi:MAG: beta-phosphoglucomutase [Lachnospiraceae bacterium]|nr:beta-phosphoglucomutase [Lachnospiraceae bacterium]
MKKHNAVIFDLDGVICFTDKYHYLAWKSMADELGIPFDEQVNDRLRGVSRMASLEIILEKSDKKYTQNEKEEIAEKKNNTYREYLKTMSEADLPADVDETLKELKNRGYKLAIGSSSKNAKTILERLGLADFFDAVSDGTNISRSKPDPEVFLKAAQFLGEAPQNCLVVEDAASGIDAASAGGFDSAGLGEAAKSSKCTYPLQSIKDLLCIEP